MTRHLTEPDPEVVAFLAAVRAAGLPPVETLSPEEARAAHAAARARANLASVPLHNVQDIAIDTRAGRVPLRLYDPTGFAPSPAVVYFHGGGWLLGGLDSHDYLCRSLAREAGVRVLAVDYPLSPEVKFPTALHAAADVVSWTFAQADELGFDVNRIGLMGDSSGANLAAVLALMSRDGELPKPKLQCLIYPILDLTMSHESYGIKLDGMPVNRKSMDWFIRHYLNEDSERRNWRASPTLVASVAGLAPAYILTAGFDVLRDEAEDYARRLSKAGVDVTLRRFPGQIHAFLSMPHVFPAAKQATSEVAAFLRTCLTE